MNILKDYVIENAITGTEKVLIAIKPVIVNSYWGDLCPDFVPDVTGFTKEPIKKVMKEMVGRAKKGGDKRFQDIDHREILVLIDTTPEELTGDNLMEVSASEPMIDGEEEKAVAENKLYTL